MDTNQYSHRSIKKTWLLVTVAVVVASLIVWGYAANFLTVSNTATVNLGAGLTGLVVQASTTCSTQTGYSNPVSINWPPVFTGRLNSAFMCLQNVGTDNYQIALSTNLPISEGTISSPQSGTVLSPGGFLLVQVDWNIPQGAPLGPVTFSITFQ